MSLNQTEKVYLASGFFTPEQNIALRYIEKVAKSLGLDTYLPESESFNFNGTHHVDYFQGRSDQGEFNFSTKDIDLKSPENMEFRKIAVELIYLNNLRRMNECARMFASLEGEDIGTAFEIGYFANTVNMLYYPMEGMVNHNWEMKRLKSSLKVYFDKGNVMEPIWNNPTQFVKDEYEKSYLEFLNISVDQEFGEAVTNAIRLEYPANTEELICRIQLICIDDRPLSSMIYLGMLASEGIPVITFSRKGYGSNVMLTSCSSHFNSVEELQKFLMNFKGPEDTQTLVNTVRSGKFDFSINLD